MPYDIESQSRNASCVPFRGRGPRSGEGVDGGKNDYDILILCLIALKGKRLTTFCASLRSGGRRLAVRTAMEYPIGALPCYTLCLFEAFPSRGNEKYGEEKQRVIYFSYHFGVFPLWWLAPPPFPRKRGHYKAPLGCELLMKGLLFRALFCPLNRGKSGAAG